MKNENIMYLLGAEELQIRPFPPYSELICEFLAELSIGLRKDNEAKKYSDIIEFAFWIRRSNILQLKKRYLDSKRLGKGLIFHIAPSNIPVNFAFSFAFGLLSGNGNIVRVSSKNFKQTKIVCKILKELLEDKKYQIIKKQNAIISYENKYKEITDYFSGICDVRIIWGGDNTINQIRQSPISSRTTEITFADRYSFGIINSDIILESNAKELKKLALDFYNDTYLMDQNACSSPHLICWKGSIQNREMAKKKFWKMVYQEALKYDLADIKVSDKYTDLCEYAVNLEIKTYNYYENLLYIITLEKLPQDITEMRGKYGLFFEYEIDDYRELNQNINSKIQTCTYFGVEEEEIRNWIIYEHLKGIDRIVPIGKALDIGIIWDGYDIVSSLSRIIALQ